MDNNFFIQILSEYFFGEKGERIEIMQKYGEGFVKSTEQILVVRFLTAVVRVCPDFDSYNFIRILPAYSRSFNINALPR